MRESVGRRKEDEKINHRIDNIIVDLNECRQGMVSTLSQLSDKVDKIALGMETYKKELVVVSGNIKSIGDMLDVWNNTKGFFSVVKLISGFAKLLVPVLFVVGALTAIFTYFYQYFNKP